MTEKILVKYLYHQNYSFIMIGLSAIFTEGQKQDIMFFLGAAAALCTIAARLFDIYIKGKNKDNQENKL